MNTLCVLPAHNEAKTILKTLASLRNQFCCVVVIIDNCTDNTAQIVQNCGIDYYTTINNKQKKAGALNQYFLNHKEIFEAFKYIVVADSDTIFDEFSIYYAKNFLEREFNHAAVCSKAGIIHPHNFKNLFHRYLWEMQNIEYGCFDSERVETAGNIKVAQGMFSMYRSDVLLSTLKFRGIVYQGITEDYELTLHLKSRGWKISSDLSIKAYTEVPIKLKELWAQRVRWLYGGIDALVSHGYKKHTMKDWNGHILFWIIWMAQIFLILASNFHVGISITAVVVLAVGFLNMIIRLKYVSHKPNAIFLFTILPIVVYSWFNIATLAAAWFFYLTKSKKIEWR